MAKQVRGVVLRVHEEPIDEAFAARIRPIAAVSGSAPAVSAEQLALWQWMSGYYMCTLGEVMSAALPSGVDKRLVDPPKRRTAKTDYTGTIEPLHELTPVQQKSTDEIECFWSSGKGNDSCR